MKAKANIKDDAKEEIVLASNDRTLCNAFRRESTLLDYVLDTVNSPQELSFFCKKDSHPRLTIIDIDSINHRNLNSFIFYLKECKSPMPLVVISRKSDISTLTEFNKNVPVLLAITREITRKSIKTLLLNMHDASNEALKEKLVNVQFLENENVFACAFANKDIYFIKRQDIAEEDASLKIKSCSVSKDGHYFLINYENDETLDVSWDFVRHVADENYEFYIGKQQQKKNANLSAQEIGQRISKARAEKGLTQEDLALKSGIVRNNISRIENGHHYPSLPLLEKIAKSLDMQVIDLIIK